MTRPDAAIVGDEPRLAEPASRDRFDRGHHCLGRHRCTHDDMHVLRSDVECVVPPSLGLHGFGESCRDYATLVGIEHKRWLLQQAVKWRPTRAIGLCGRPTVPVRITVNGTTVVAGCPCAICVESDEVGSCLGRSVSGHARTISTALRNPKRAMTHHCTPRCSSGCLHRHVLTPATLITRHSVAKP
jgi:hypothetical protein